LQKGQPRPFGKILRLIGIATHQQNSQVRVTFQGGASQFRTVFVTQSQVGDQQVNGFVLQVAQGLARTAKTDRSEVEAFEVANQKTGEGNVIFDQHHPPFPV